MRPIYESPSMRRRELAVLDSVRVRLAKLSARLGPLIDIEQTRELEMHDRVMTFARGRLFLEVKCRSVKFADFMISEAKVQHLRGMVAEDRARGQESLALLLISVPEGKYKEIIAFNVETRPVARRMGGRVDRGDGLDREMCLYFDWGDGVLISKMPLDEAKRPVHSDRVLGPSVEGKVDGSRNAG